MPHGLETLHSAPPYAMLVLHIAQLSVAVLVRQCWLKPPCASTTLITSQQLLCLWHSG